MLLKALAAAAPTRNSSRVVKKAIIMPSAPCANSDIHQMRKPSQHNSRNKQMCIHKITQVFAGSFRTQRGVAEVALRRRGRGQGGSSNAQHEPDGGETSVACRAARAGKTLAILRGPAAAASATHSSGSEQWRQWHRHVRPIRQRHRHPRGDLGGAGTSGSATATAAQTAAGAASAAPPSLGHTKWSTRVTDQLFLCSNDGHMSKLDLVNVLYTRRARCHPRRREGRARGGPPSHLELRSPPIRLALRVLASRQHSREPSASLSCCLGSAAVRHMDGGAPAR